MLQKTIEHGKMENNTRVVLFKGGELSDRGSLVLCDSTKLQSTKAVFGLEVDHYLLCPGALRTLKFFLQFLKTENIYPWPKSCKGTQTHLPLVLNNVSIKESLSADLKEQSSPLSSC